MLSQRLSRLGISLSRLFSIENKILERLSLLSVSSVVIAIFLAGCSGPPKHAAWKTTTSPGDLERLMWQAIQKKNWKEVELHLSPSFAGVNDRGKLLDGNAWMEYWKGAAVERVQLDDLDVHSAGAGMVVTFVLRLSRASQPQLAGNQTYQGVSVWQQLKAGWILTSTSLTPVLPE